MLTLRSIADTLTARCGGWTRLHTKQAAIHPSQLFTGYHAYSIREAVLPSELKQVFSRVCRSVVDITIDYNNYPKQPSFQSPGCTLLRRVRGIYLFDVKQFLRVVSPVVRSCGMNSRLDVSGSSLHRIWDTYVCTHVTNSAKDLPMLDG